MLMAKKRFIVSGAPRLAQQYYNFYPVLKTKAVVDPHKDQKTKLTIEEANTNSQS